MTRSLKSFSAALSRRQVTIMTAPITHKIKGSKSNHSSPTVNLNQTANGLHSTGRVGRMMEHNVEEQGKEPPPARRECR